MLKGVGFSVFASCEVVTKLTDNNISNISMHAIICIRSLSDGTPLVETDFFFFWQELTKAVAETPA